MVLTLETVVVEVVTDVVVPQTVESHTIEELLQVGRVCQVLQ